MLQLQKFIPFLKFQESQDDKRPWFWSDLPKILWEPHVDYFIFIGQLRDFIRDELDIKSVRLTS